jgi:tetratricopeptide (TPR) repeat protein
MRKSFVYIILALTFSGIGVMSEPQRQESVHQDLNKPAFLTIDTAEVYFARKEWQNAITAYSAITSENPYNGEFFIRLGDSYFEVGDYTNSNNAYENAVATGQSYSDYFSVSYVMYRIAQNYASMKDKEKALAWFVKAAQTKQGILPWMSEKDTVLKSVIGDTKAFQTQYPSIDPNISRNDGWRRDLEYLCYLLEKRHYAFNERVDLKNWRKIVTSINKRIPSMSDWQIIAEFIKLAAMLHDSHTVVGPFFSKKFALHMIPICFHDFKDGLFIQQTSEAYKSILCSKVIAINNMPLEEAWNRMGPFLGYENSINIRALTPALFSLPEYLAAASIGADASKVTLTLRKDGHIMNAEVTPQNFDLQLFASKDGFIKDGISMHGTSNLPLYLKKVDDLYWFEHDKQRNVVYFQFNNVFNKPDYSFQKFVSDLFDYISQNSVDYLIVDLRFNTGGNTLFLKPLIQSIVGNTRINQHGRLFVITSRYTLSAALNLASCLDRYTEALFVGEPTGCSPNFVGENTWYTLPYSGLSASVSNIYWQGGLNSNDNRLWIAPDIAVEISSDDYLNNRDPVLDAIYQHIER